MTDDGAGLRPGFNEGVGLANTQQPLRGLYGDRQEFELTNNGCSDVRVAVCRRSGCLRPKWQPLTNLRTAINDDEPLALRAYAN